MLQNISIPSKCSSFELPIHKRILRRDCYHRNK